jgi:hypothetical protein
VIPPPPPVPGPPSPVPLPHAVGLVVLPPPAQCSWRFELANILFNLGALESVAACSISRGTPEGIKEACQHFQVMARNTPALQHSRAACTGASQAVCVCVPLGVCTLSNPPTLPHSHPLQNAAGVFHYIRETIVNSIPGTLPFDLTGAGLSMVRGLHP